MNKTAWIKEKTKFLSDYLNKKNDGNVNIEVQEKLPATENKTIDKTKKAKFISEFGFLKSNR